MSRAVVGELTTNLSNEHVGVEDRKSILRSMLADRSLVSSTYMVIMRRNDADDGRLVHVFGYVKSLSDDATVKVMRLIKQLIELVDRATQVE